MFDPYYVLEQEFYSKIIRPKRLLHDCVEWLGKINESGYGVLDGGQYAHRISYLMRYERIPKGWEIDHLCRNKKCVNPHHLEAVTKTINQQRRDYQRNPDGT